ncbi:TonB-dependent receptor [Bacteroides fragilis]|nr:TonB-dependent receptor [Bacteroides fragilis]
MQEKHSSNSNRDKSCLTSFLGRVNYNFDNTYYAGVSYRRDGSSRLSRDNRWGNFWSISGSWRFMQESILESIKNVITDGKLRLSYGVNIGHNLVLFIVIQLTCIEPDKFITASPGIELSVLVVLI